MSKQQIVTYKLSSRDRNTTAWPSTDRYCVDLPETLGGVRQISLSGVDAPFLQRTVEYPGGAFLYREGLVLDTHARVTVTFRDAERGSHTVVLPPSHQHVTLTPKGGAHYWVDAGDPGSAVHGLSVHLCPSKMLLIACDGTGGTVTYPVVGLGKTDGTLHLSLPDSCELSGASSFVLHTKPLMLANILFVLRLAFPSITVRMDKGRLRLDADDPFRLRMDDALFRALGWSCPSRASRAFQKTHQAENTPWGSWCYVRPSSVYSVDKWRTLLRHSMNMLYFKSRPHFVMGIYDGSMHMVTLPCGHFGCIDNLLRALCASMTLSIKHYTCSCAVQTFECGLDIEGRVSLSSNLPFALHFADATATPQLVEALHFDRLNRSGGCAYVSAWPFETRSGAACHTESHLEYVVLDEDACETASGVSLTSKHIIYGSGSPIAECAAPGNGAAALIADFNSKKTANYAYWYKDGAQHKILSDCFLTYRTGAVVRIKQLVGGSCTYTAEVKNVALECGGVVMDIGVLCADAGLPAELNANTAVAVFLWWPDPDALFDLPFAHQTDRHMPTRMGFGHRDYLCQSHYVSPHAWTPHLSHSILLHIDTQDGQVGRWKMTVGENGIVPYTSTFRSPGSDMQSATYQESVIMYLSGATINRIKVTFTNMDGTPYNFHGRDNVVTLAFVY